MLRNGINHGHLTVSTLYSVHTPAEPLSSPTAFNLAVRAIEGNTPLTPHRQQLNTRYTLSLYGLYQQAMHGDCGEGDVVVTEKRPGVGSFPGRALGAAWASRRGMSREEAMVCCSDALIELLTDVWIFRWRTLISYSR